MAIFRNEPEEFQRLDWELLQNGALNPLMSQLFRFPNAIKRDPGIEGWMNEHSGELGLIARRWFEVMRNCGADVRELLHDGHRTACVDDAAFGYVNASKAHVNVGFFAVPRLQTRRICWKELASLCAT
jgi:hypothetical protein